MASPVRVIPLGGLGEIGKNVTVIEYDGEFILIDCGLTFPREQGMFGVDIVLPDLTWVHEHADGLRGVVITHAHEDHIGALPFLMRQVDVPDVWATRFTLGLLKSRADEHGLVEATRWNEIVPEEGDITIGPFQLEFVRVSHSVPDCVAIVVHTPEGTIVHSGDLRLDPSPLDGVRTDLATLAEIGGDGVALYLGDSTNADIPGHVASEMSLGGPLRDIVHRAPGRVIATCFSSHIHRLQQLIDIAQEDGRAICVLGRSMNRNVNIAKNLGYIDVGGATLIKPHRLEEHDLDGVMVLCTGSQGEPLAALQRIADGTHPNVGIEPSDTIVFSTRTIPGNEVRVHRMINQFARVGTHLYHGENAHVHVSGHGYSEELKTVLQLLRPRTFMPVHGEWRHMRAHADLARMVGIESSRVILGETGRVVEVRDGKAVLTDDTVHVGEVLVDRHSSNDIVDHIVAERQQASGDGMLVVVARLERGRGHVDVISRGFLDDDAVLEDAQDAARASLNQFASGSGELDHNAVQQGLRDSVHDVVFDATRRSPLIVPVLIDD